MKYIITSAVADLRSHPDEIYSKDYSHQEGRLSQCNEGERVEVIRKEGEWALVSAEEQWQCSNRIWRGYRGWLHLSEIEHRISKQQYSFTKKVVKESLLRDSEVFLGLPYLWGGCSLPIEGRIASVDCSGLIYLLFKRQGRFIPRDAHDQYLAAERVMDPMPGDLLFLRPLSAKRVTHVLLLFDEEHFLESPETGKRVRLLRKGSEFWQENGLYHFFDRSKVYFGCYGRF